MEIAYIRVSTVEQNEARQVAAMEGFKIEKWFIEKASAKNADRPKLKEMLDFCREGDVIHIHDFSRLARTTKDLLEIVETLKGKGVALVSNKEGLDTETPTGKLILTVIAAINEFERMNLLERQREGIAIAKANGTYKGRKRKPVDKDVFDALLGQYRRREINKTGFADALGCSRPTLDRIIKEMGVST